MTTKEKLMMQVNSEFIRNLIKQRNAGTEDCITSSELAREIGIPWLTCTTFSLRRKCFADDIGSCDLP